MVNFDVIAKNHEKVTFKISVTDQGIGIPEDKLEKIFNKFDQADVSTTRKYGGTGLGLSISKGLAALLAANITVTSSTQGSTFCLTIELALASDEFVANVNQANNHVNSKKLTLSNTSILLVEDNPVNQKFMMHALKKYGCQITPSANGQEAIVQYRKQKFDLILMDCQMPVMDGYSATKAIRLLEQKNGTRTPIIAITANALKTDKAKSLHCGMDDHITKPFTRHILETVLTRWIDVAKQTFS